MNRCIAYDEIGGFTSIHGYFSMCMSTLEFTCLYQHAEIEGKERDQIDKIAVFFRIDETHAPEAQVFTQYDLC